MNLRGATLPASCLVTRDPRRLRALCALWQSAEQEVCLTLRGCSMMPTIAPGARLTLRCGRGEPRVGEIAAFHRGAALIVHRVIAIIEPDAGNPRQFVCQGDGNAAPDPPVAAEEIVGIVVRIDPPRPLARLKQRVKRMAQRGRAMLRRGRAKIFLR